jgi:hypothetical protein
MKIMFRVITFGLNGFVLRYTSAAMLGVVNVRCACSPRRPYVQADSAVLDHSFSEPRSVPEGRAEQPA